MSARALQTLKNALGGPGGIIILMTDGEENEGCKNPNGGGTWDMTHLTWPVDEAEVIVVTMAFG